MVTKPVPQEYHLGVLWASPPQLRESCLMIYFFGTFIVKLLPRTLFTWPLCGTIIPILISTISLRSSCFLPLPIPLPGFFVINVTRLFLFSFFKFSRRPRLLAAGFISHLYFFGICKILHAFRTKFKWNFQRLYTSWTKHGVEGKGGRSCVTVSLGSLRSYDGNCNENVTLKLNFALS